MKKTGLFVALGAYLAGITAATFYGKNSKQLKKDLEKADENGESKLKVVFGAFVDTHTNMFNNIKKDILSEENLKKYKEYKEDILTIFDTYREKGSKLMAELKEKGIDYADKSLEKLENLYESKRDDIEKLKGLSKSTISELKEKLASIFNSTKEEIEEEIAKVRK